MKVEREMREWIKYCEWTQNEGYVGRIYCGEERQLGHLMCKWFRAVAKEEWEIMSKGMQWVVNPCWNERRVDKIGCGGEVFQEQIVQGHGYKGLSGLVLLKPPQSNSSHAQKICQSL